MMVTQLIINISSCQGCMTQQSVDSFTEYNFGVDPYIDSMSRIETLTKSIALELATKGIRVNGIDSLVLYLMI